ncbi:hypothetical protein B0H17DRAFT_1143959 [Mycena rosella]|uniref:Uncharacterized protein n=1 Tax=Mycena rosella TaxID=1033263 RepID=A0AAD7CTR3_MYCRO|nr:hypothetical protein B0H17DRAFT_1143959 [Mycena rosella]
MSDGEDIVVSRESAAYGEPYVLHTAARHDAWSRTRRARSDAPGAPRAARAPGAVPRAAPRTAPECATSRVGAQDAGRGRVSPARDTVRARAGSALAPARDMTMMPGARDESASRWGAGMDATAEDWDRHRETSCLPPAPENPPLQLAATDTCAKPHIAPSPPARPRRARRGGAREGAASLATHDSRLSPRPTRHPLCAAATGAVAAVAATRTHGELLAATAGPGEDERAVGAQARTSRSGRERWAGDTRDDGGWTLRDAERTSGLGAGEDGGEQRAGRRGRGRASPAATRRGRGAGKGGDGGAAGLRDTGARTRGGRLGDASRARDGLRAVERCDGRETVEQVEEELRGVRTTGHQSPKTLLSAGVHQMRRAAADDPHRDRRELADAMSGGRVGAQAFGEDVGGDDAERAARILARGEGGGEPEHGGAGADGGGCEHRYPRRRRRAHGRGEARGGAASAGRAYSPAGCGGDVGANAVRGTHAGGAPARGRGAGAGGERGALQRAACGGPPPWRAASACVTYPLCKTKLKSFATSILA